MKKYALPTYPAEQDVWDVLREETRPLVVYGMGNGADKLLLQCERRGIQIADFMASDGFVRGQVFHGKTVLSLAQVKEKYPAFVLVLAFASSRPEVLEMLFDMADAYPLYMPDLPVVGEACFDKSYYNAHYREFVRTASSFSDALSCNLYAAVLQYKLTGDIRILKDAYTTPEDTAALIPYADIKTYVDCGAYNGDTLRDVVQAGACLEHAVCIEPDRRNFKKLSAYAETLTDVPVKCVHAAVHQTNCMGVLAGSGNRNSSLVGASYENRAEEVPLVTIDAVCEDITPDYIKYDVEGAELPAISGSALTITRARPYVLLSLYHRTEDLIVLPPALREIAAEYDFYLRRPLCVPAWELNLIAIPRA